jgi:hypothetical protein
MVQVCTTVSGENESRFRRWLYAGLSKFDATLVTLKHAFAVVALLRPR